MAYVITQPCVGEKNAKCVGACPVDCIYEGNGQDIGQYVINPAECIDCDACRPVCPVGAIFPQAEVPKEWQDFIEINKRNF